MGEEWFYNPPACFGNRTFDNWNDFGAVVKSIGWKQTCLFVDKIPICDPKEIPERFCILVAEAIREGVIK